MQVSSKSSSWCILGLCLQSESLTNNPSSKQCRAVQTEAPRTSPACSLLWCIASDMHGLHVQGHPCSRVPWKQRLQPRPPCWASSWRWMCWSSLAPVPWAWPLPLLSSWPLLLEPAGNSIFPHTYPPPPPPLQQHCPVSICSSLGSPMQSKTHRRPQAGSGCARHCLPLCPGPGHLSWSPPLLLFFTAPPPPPLPPLQRHCKASACRSQGRPSLIRDIPQKALS